MLVRMENILVLVHPGSCCGSANMNVGQQLADAFRRDIADELDRWSGGIVVIDGSLSDELPEYPGLHSAIELALKRAKDAGLLAERHHGCDDVPPHHPETAARLIAEGKLDAKKHEINITGAWYDPDDREGCVNEVASVFEGAGFSVAVLDSVAAIEVGSDDDPDLEGEGPEESASPSI